MKPFPFDFPDEFAVQPIRLPAANALTRLSANEIAAYFRAHPEVARELLSESYDKRWTPASFIKEDEFGFTVGWFSTKYRSEYTRRFSNLADAATDYLLFSLGRGRWAAPSDDQSSDRIDSSGSQT